MEGVKRTISYGMHVPNEINQKKLHRIAIIDTRNSLPSILIVGQFLGSRDHPISS